MSDVKRQYRAALQRAMSTDKHELNRVGSGKVACSCGEYESPHDGRDSADAWRSHLIDVATDALSEVFVNV